VDSEYLAMVVEIIKIKVTVLFLQRGSKPEIGDKTAEIQRR